MKFCNGIVHALLFLACLSLHCFGNNGIDDDSNVTVAEQHDLKDDWIDAMFELLRHNTQFEHNKINNESDSDTYLDDVSSFINQLDADLRTLFGNELGSQISSSWVNEFYPTPPEPNSSDLYVDEYVRELLAIQADPDCTSSQGEVDLASPDFSIERAVQVWQKCRVLVIRNAYSEEMIRDFRQNATQLVYDVKDGRVNTEGTTTYKETYYVHEVESRRWDMLLPKKLARDPYLMAHPAVMDIVTDNRVLGEDITCMAYGMFMAEPTAKGQMWHTDTPGLFGDWDMMEEVGFAGHHVPSAALTMFVPLQDMSGELGPTQFCVGAHALNGMPISSMKPERDGGWLTFKDPQLREELMNLVNIKDEKFFEEFIIDICPRGMWYSPILNLGDIAFWDYSTVHRSGPNNSKDIFRSIAYVSYARNGVKDTAFDGYRKGELTFAESSYILGRFAKPLFGYNSTQMENDKYNVQYYDDEDIEEEKDEVLITEERASVSLADGVFSETQCLPSSQFLSGESPCTLNKDEIRVSRERKSTQAQGLPNIERFLN